MFISTNQEKNAQVCSIPRSPDVRKICVLYVYKLLCSE
jgi:hypothetical protein